VFGHTRQGRRMSADLASVSIDLAPRCQQCGRLGEFGYRWNDGSMRWFCGEHRLAQFWADARIPPAESTGNGLPKPLDEIPWNRPTAGVDGQLVPRPAGPTSRPAPVAVDRTPHFDDAGRFIHTCCKCGRDAHLGIGVNLRAGQLGKWFCAKCKPLAHEACNHG